MDSGKLKIIQNALVLSLNIGLIRPTLGNDLDQKPNNIGRFERKEKKGNVWSFPFFWLRSYHSFYEMQKVRELEIRKKNIRRPKSVSRFGAKEVVGTDVGVVADVDVDIGVGIFVNFDTGGNF